MRYWIATFIDSTAEFEADTLNELKEDIIEYYVRTCEHMPMLEDITMEDENGVIDNLSYSDLADTQSEIEEQIAIRNKEIYDEMRHFKVEKYFRFRGL